MLRRPHTYLQLGCIFLVSPLIVCGALAYIPVSFHNAQLNKFANNLYKFPLPAQTVIVNRQHKVELMGNSNHCDFYAEQTMTTKLTRQEIEDYYQDAELPAVGIENQIAFIRVEFDDSPKPSGELLFKISVLDYGNPTNLDFRCH